jgi:hypothetical protein
MIIGIALLAMGGVMFYRAYKLRGDLRMESCFLLGLVATCAGITQLFSY